MGRENVEAFLRSIESKSTEELLEIWQEHDRKEWSEGTFELIKQLLIERGETLPHRKKRIKKAKHLVHASRVVAGPSQEEIFLWVIGIGIMLYMTGGLETKYRIAALIGGALGLSAALRTFLSILIPILYKWKCNACGNIVNQKASTCPNCNKQFK